MLGTPPGYPSPPDLETPCLKLLAHDLDDLFLCQPSLSLNRIERGLIIPRHFDNGADLILANVVCLTHASRDIILLEDVTKSPLHRLRLTQRIP